MGSNLNISSMRRRSVKCGAAALLSSFLSLENTYQIGGPASNFNNNNMSTCLVFAKRLRVRTSNESKNPKMTLFRQKLPFLNTNLKLESSINDNLKEKVREAIRTIIEANVDNTQEFRIISGAAALHDIKEEFHKTYQALVSSIIREQIKNNVDTTQELHISISSHESDLDALQNMLESIRRYETQIRQKVEEAVKTQIVEAHVDNTQVLRIVSGDSALHDIKAEYNRIYQALVSSITEEQIKTNVDITQDLHISGRDFDFPALQSMAESIRIKQKVEEAVKTQIVEARVDNTQELRIISGDAALQDIKQEYDRTYQALVSSIIEEQIKENVDNTQKREGDLRY